MVFFKSVTMLAAGVMLGVAAASAQPPTPKDGEKKDSKTEVGKKDSVPTAAPTSVLDATTASPGGSDKDEKKLEGDILPYYENYLREYRLGPADQISVEVFGQCPDYCKTGITVPPNARISYPLIREGIFVAGKTVEEIAAEITKKLDEYIIEPKVTVTLDKAVATRYSVMGNVGQPGVRVMDRRVSVYEAVTSAGGVTREGDRKKVAIVSYTKDGHLERKIVNLADMENGKAKLTFLQPGDQVFVPNKGFSLAKVLEIMSRASTLRYMIPGLPNIPIPSVPYYPY